MSWEDVASVLRARVRAPARSSVFHSKHPPLFLHLQLKGRRRKASPFQRVRRRCLFACRIAVGVLCAIECLLNALKARIGTRHAPKKPAIVPLALLLTAGKLLLSAVRFAPPDDNRRLSTEKLRCLLLSTCSFENKGTPLRISLWCVFVSRREKERT